MNNNALNEFSRPFNLENVKKNGSHLKLEATSEECASLASRYSIPKIKAVLADCRLTKRAQKETGDYLLEVALNAQVVQTCVLSLEQVDEKIEERFSIVFKTDEEGDDDALDLQEVEFELDDDDIEYIEDYEVDLGGYVSEYLSLFINPYPKKADADAGNLGHKVLTEDEIDAKTKRENPFNVLKDLKHKT